MTHKRTKKNGQRGAALMELALCVPFLLMVTFAVVDLGRWLNLHLTASRLAFEAARYAASLPNLETGTHSGTIGTVTGLPVNQKQVFDRIGQIVTRQNYTKQKIDPTVMELNHTDAKTGASEDNIVVVTVQLPYSSFFGSVIPLTSVRASARTAYLFPAS